MFCLGSLKLIFIIEFTIDTLGKYRDEPVSFAGG